MNNSNEQGNEADAGPAGAVNSGSQQLSSSHSAGAPVSTADPVGASLSKTAGATTAVGYTEDTSVSQPQDGSGTLPVPAEAAAQLQGEQETFTNAQDSKASSLDKSTIDDGVQSCRNVWSLLRSIDQRLTVCEQFLGNVDSIHESLSVDPSYQKEQDTRSSLQPGDGGGEATESKDVLQNREWRGKLEAIVHSKASLGAQINKLQQLTDHIFRGKPSEVNKKLTTVHEWIEAEGAAFSRILLSLGAKKTYLLQNEARIREMVVMLRQVEDLKPYINPSSFAGLLKAKERIAALEQSGYELGCRVSRIQSELEDLCFQYSSSIHMVSCILFSLTEEASAAEA